MVGEEKRRDEERTGWQQAISGAGGRARGDGCRVGVTLFFAFSRTQQQSLGGVRVSDALMLTLTPTKRTSKLCLRGSMVYFAS